jgi:hypothetical protein
LGCRSQRGWYIPDDNEVRHRRVPSGARRRHRQIGRVVPLQCGTRPPAGHLLTRPGVLGRGYALIPQGRRRRSTVRARRSLQLAEALTLFKKAAEQGHVGMPNLANSYARGDGVEKDLAASLDWNTRAANAGNAQPMFNLGSMYFLGRGVPKRTRTAHQIGCERQQRLATPVRKKSSMPSDLNLLVVCWAYWRCDGWGGDCVDCHDDQMDATNNKRKSHFTFCTRSSSFFQRQPVMVSWLPPTWLTMLANAAI